ncbi:MAG: peptidoglycan-binding protein [Clostridiales bacterium]|nr:peptidoglycan-binding protein [Clostridiales bacterium]MDD7036136.1 peptidoglycan-binding protein [Bacillota bacterium]MDY2920185.1 peptidoglycan-binding protein [Lentihominibacter sp.]
MKKKLLSLVISLAMLAALIPVSSFGASKTYTGSWPTLPNALAKKAIECCWPYGTSSIKYKYSTGNPTDAYQEALDAAYPEDVRSKWGQAKSRAGASCDVFVGTVARASGYDYNFPRALSKDLTYLPGTTSKWKKVSVTKVKDMQPGDIIMYLNKGGGGHICVYVEVNDVGYIANAHYQDKGGCYGVMDAKAKDYNPSNYKSFAVYRQVTNKVSFFSKGDRSSEVKKLQQFLNWAGFDCGTPDGSFGPATETAVKNFQKAVGIEVDGKFGVGSLNAAKSYVPGQIVSKPLTTDKTVTVKKAYTGKYPASTVSKKKGTKTNIKRWQSYLKWYGYSSIKVDGKFGNQTVKYTKAFQKKNGLKADGVAGSKTIAKAKKVKK